MQHEAKQYASGDTRKTSEYVEHDIGNARARNSREETSQREVDK
jgi:hypothetical protein